MFLEKSENDESSETDSEEGTKVNPPDHSQVRCTLPAKNPKEITKELNQYQKVKDDQSHLNIPVLEASPSKISSLVSKKHKIDKKNLKQ